MSEVKKEFGKHYIVDFINCNAEVLKFVDGIQKAFEEAAHVSEATVLNSFYHQFDPIGVSGIVLIAESHFSLHTWPEDNYVAFDILTCGTMFPEKAIESLRLFFQAEKVNTQILSRGF